MILKVCYFKLILIIVLEDKKVFETSTPDIFAATPIEIKSNEHNNLDLPKLDINENTLGYYIPSLNETLNKKYKIIGVCGKGIFSTVVKVLDITDNKEYAVKMIRNIDIMLISGNKEKNILKKIKEVDKQGRIFFIFYNFR